MKSIAKRCWLAAIALVVALVALALVFRFEAPQIAPVYCGDAFDRIQLGMMQMEVENIFGGPEGNYNAGPFVGPPCGVGLPVKSDGRSSSVKWLIWTYDDAEVIVGLNANGRVDSAKATPNLYGTGRGPSFYDELRVLFKRIF